MFSPQQNWVGLINRCALAPVSAAGTGANALRLIPKSNVDKALSLNYFFMRCQNPPDFG